MKDKINYLFKSYFLNIILILVGLSFIHWLLITKIVIKYCPVTPMLIYLIMPLIMSFALVEVDIKPKIKLLRFKHKPVVWSKIYRIVLGSITFIMLFSSQLFVKSFFSSTKVLNSVTQLKIINPPEYFKIKNYYIDKTIFEEHRDHYKGNFTGNYSFYLNKYYVFPIFESEKDISKNGPVVWLGMEFNKILPKQKNRLNIEEEFLKFENEVKSKIDKMDFSKIEFFQSQCYHNDAGIMKAIFKNQHYKHDNRLLIPLDESNRIDIASMLKWFLFFLLSWPLIWLFMISIPKIDAGELQKIKAGIFPVDNDDPF